MTTLPRNPFLGPRPAGPALAQASRYDGDEIPTFRHPSAPKPKPQRPDPHHFNPRALKTPAPPKRRKAEPPPPIDGALMTASEVAALLRVSEKSLEHHRRRGTGPAWICLGGARRGVRYRRADVDQYITDLTRNGGGAP
jgi:hypothetical protein